MHAVVRRHVRAALTAASLALSVLPAAAPRAALGAAAERPLRLAVDATEVPRGILHATLEIPARPGELTLVYPKWIPGEHGPTGPIVNLAGLRFSAGGRAVPWTRDALDMYAFHLRVPSGAAALQVALDFTLSGQGHYSAGESATARLLTLEWNQVVLYPAGRAVTALPVAARLKLPGAWTYGTALSVTREALPEVEFAPVSLLTLVDSPVLAGADFRTVDISPAGGPPHAVHLACDDAAGLAVSPGLIAGWKQLVTEAGALFGGARHYRRYDFLVALSDHVEHFGLEHHESSDDRLGERALVDEDLRLGAAGLLPHEYVHSWNGKYRMPEGLLGPDYQKTRRTNLLWVYEGLTSYLGWVLSARSGLVTPERALESLAFIAAEMDKQAGRAWRPLEDTAVDAQDLYGAPASWESWRRKTDFYDEGVLLWLEVDVTLRQRTGGRRSIDDFCAAFHGGRSGPPAEVPYGFDDLVKALNQVAPYDWRGFFRARLDDVAPRAPLGGIEGGGWRVVWSDSESAAIRAREKSRAYTDLRFSIGLTLDKDGAIRDVVPGSAAAEAGLGPGMKPIAVGGRRFSVERLREALRAGRDGTAPLELLAESGEFVRPFRVEWHGGELYPALARDPARPDLLSEILKPRTPRVAPGGGDGE